MKTAGEAVRFVPDADATATLTSWAARHGVTITYGDEGWIDVYRGHCALRRYPCAGLNGAERAWVVRCAVEFAVALALAGGAVLGAEAVDLTASWHVDDG